MARDQSAGGGVTNVAIIAAVARNRAIGASGGMPWRVSSDLKRFRALTWGKPLIMGRKTYESIGRPLAGRRVIVITRSATLDVETAPDLASALSKAAGAEEIMIGGGGEIYALALPLTARLYLTEIDASPSADVFFPALDPAQWQVEHRETGVRGPLDDHDYAFVNYSRIMNAA